MLFCKLIKSSFSFISKFGHLAHIDSVLKDFNVPLDDGQLIVFCSYLFFKIRVFRLQLWHSTIVKFVHLSELVDVDWQAEHFKGAGISVLLFACLTMDANLELMAADLGYQTVEGLEYRLFVQGVGYLHRRSSLCVGKLDRLDLLLELFGFIGPFSIDSSEKKVLLYDSMMLFSQQACDGCCLFLDVFYSFSHDVRLQISYNRIVLQLHLFFLFLHLKLYGLGMDGTYFARRVHFTRLYTILFLKQWLLLSFVREGSVKYVGAPAKITWSPIQSVPIFIQGLGLLRLLLLIFEERTFLVILIILVCNQAGLQAR